ncbi:MAG: hypothetical protein WBA25_15785 [Jannaschia sp.]
MADTDLHQIVLETLHGTADGYRDLVRDLAVAQPDLPASRLESVLLAVAREIDVNLQRSGAPTDEARLARRLALLLGMDIDILTARLTRPPTLGDLMVHWTANDDFFLRL